MKTALALIAVLAGMVPASAEDRFDRHTGGLVLAPSYGGYDVERVELFVSPDIVRITYRVHNSTSSSLQLGVTFPIPDVRGELFGNTDTAAPIPSGFSLERNGVPAPGTLHQFVTALGVDRTDVVREMDLPLNPADAIALNVPGETPKVSAEQLARLQRLGMTTGWIYEIIEGQDPPPPTYSAMWTLHSSFALEDSLGPNEVVEYVLSYPPAARTVIQFLDRYDTKPYCPTEQMMTTASGWVDHPTWFLLGSATVDLQFDDFQFTGPVQEFRLVLDGMSPNRLVMACSDVPLQKTGPTRYETVQRGEKVYLPGILRVLFVEPEETLAAFSSSPRR